MDEPRVETTWGCESVMADRETSDQSWNNPSPLSYSVIHCILHFCPFDKEASPKLDGGIIQRERENNPTESKKVKPSCELKKWCPHQLVKLFVCVSVTHAVCSRGQSILGCICIHRHKHCIGHHCGSYMCGCSWVPIDRVDTLHHRDIMLVSEIMTIYIYINTTIHKIYIYTNIYGHKYLSTFTQLLCFTNFLWAKSYLYFPYEVQQSFL